MTGTIKVFDSLFHDAALIHTEEATGTFSSWLSARAPEYDPLSDRQPIQVTQDGVLVPPCKWSTLEIRDLEIRPYPQDAGTFVAAAVSVGKWIAANWFAVTTAALSAYSAYSAYKAGGRGSGATRGGDQIDQASLRANVVAFGSPIPELAGIVRRYPDRLNQVRTYFADKRTMKSEVLLCVGAGEYETPIEELRIGETRALSLGGALQIQVHQPNESLAGNTAADCWFNSPEVGATTSGNSGIKLKLTSKYSNIDPNAVLSFFSKSVSVSGDTIPADWEVGMMLQIEQMLTYTITDGGLGRDVISGNGVQYLQPFVGMKIEIRGDNEGIYTVNSYTAGTGGTPEVVGSPSTLVGDSVPAGYDFTYVPLDITVNSQPVYVDWDVTNIYLLVNELNSQLAITNIRADVTTGGVLRLYEVQPYSGTAITVTGDASLILGASPVSTTGTAYVPAVPSSPASMTLNFENGSPVTGLSIGSAEMAIGYRGLRYQVINIISNTLTLARLTDTGDIDSAWLSFMASSGTDSSMQPDPSAGEGGWTGPFRVPPQGVKCSVFEFDIFFPRGLYWINSKGGTWKNQAYCQVQWRDEAVGGPWFSEEIKFDEWTGDQIGFTYRKTLTEGDWVIRFRRTRGYTSPNKGMSDMELFGLRALMYSPEFYEGMTTMSVKFEGSDLIGAQAENQINGVFIRKLPVKTAGVWTAPVPTNDIAPWFYHVARSIGYDFNQIDQAEIDRLDTVWRAVGNTYNWIHADGTVRSNLSQALAAGYSELTMLDSKLSVVRDEPRTTPEQMFAVPAMTKSNPLSKSVSLPRPDDADGVDVEFINSETWTKDVVECRLHGDLGLKVEKVTVNGITDRTRAWRYGMRIRRAQKYRRWTYSFGTEMAGLNANYWSFVAIGDDVVGSSQSAELEDIRDDGFGAALMTVSEPLDWSQAGIKYIALRKETGDLLGPYIATQGANSREVIADIDPADWPVVDINTQELPHVLFGVNWHIPALVTAVKPEGTRGASITAVNYDVRVYADDNNNPPTGSFIWTFTSAPYALNTTIESVASGFEIAAVGLRSAIVDALYDEESVSSGFEVASVALRNSTIDALYADESVQGGFEVKSVSLRSSVYDLIYDAESAKSGIEIKSIRLPREVHPLQYDGESTKSGIEIASIALRGV